ncbi:hypothetical protein Cylst_6426 (plasmid) [Cylindrospermum stagnale PCC 7417]|uniref:Uncharacterized protein n=1 Tax=Cylindrospermum stagnale PCC 7417 TaxID=56107 RepID=K9X7Y3_9NOST|nr:DUF5674 family protein [Cylindrospermum stagnale]AFZ28219.1 hypothetical protein Cylst_6426 [Cylindrospermum stagnale PCC 7417]
MILILRERATQEQVESMLQTLKIYIKVAVDIEKGILAGVDMNQNLDAKKSGFNVTKCQLA